MPLIAQLCGEHRAIEEQAWRLLQIVASPIPDAAAVAMLRWRMVEALGDHCRREDRIVLDRMLVSGDAPATAAARAYRRGDRSLPDRFGDYIAEWPIDRVATEWPGFSAATEAMVTRSPSGSRSRKRCSTCTSGA
ncbi:MAG: hypothetical protein WDN24_08975 [Sphingomonas sp.]